MSPVQTSRVAAAALCLFVLVAPALQAQTAPPAGASSSAAADDDLPDLSTLDDDQSSSSSSSDSSDSLGGDIDLDTHFDSAKVAAEALTCVGVYDLAIDNNMQEPGSDAAQRVTDMMDKRDSAASLYLGSAAKLQADADADYKVSDADVAAKVARGDMVLDDEVSTCDDLIDLYGGWA